jgi:hypothetical protein
VQNVKVALFNNKKNIIFILKKTIINLNFLRFSYLDSNFLPLGGNLGGIEGKKIRT